MFIDTYFFPQLVQRHFYSRLMFLLIGRVYEVFHGCVWYGTGILGTGIDFVPNLPKCPIPVLVLYRNYRSVRYRCEGLYRYRRYRYPCRTELTDVARTGIDLVPKLAKSPIPVLMSYRSYRIVRYIGNTGGMTRYVPYRTHPSFYAVQRYPLDHQLE